MSQTDTAHAWWSRLRHQGLLLSPVVMIERYPEAPPDAPFHAKNRLRDAHTRFASTLGEGGEADQTAILNFVDSLLENFVGHPAARLAKQHSIPEKLTVPVRIGSKTETIRPHRVLYADDSTGTTALLVMADTSSHVGRGRGRTKYAHLLELLRGTGHRLGLLTNGQQFRLVYAGLDFESWCEWESDRWFEDGEGTEELLGLRQLLSPDSLKPIKEGVSGLLDGVEESRKRQADLSSVLRENVRQAVEHLLDEVSTSNRTNAELFKSLVQHDGDRKLTDTEAHEALMQATVRVVMRLVVCLFAESRQLLPVNDPIYSQSYGVKTLYELLDEATRCEGGTHVLFNRQTAWPRMMALFRLVYGGSSHGAFPLRPYGGVLFRPGDETSSDPVARALHILEHSVTVADATIYYVLRKLLRGPLPVIKGKSKTFVDGPVDYTDLRTEFIGLIYEGLLDYRVKRTDEQIGPQVFLNIGREPVLPLSRLTDMLTGDKKGLKDLLTTLRKEKATATVADEEEDSDKEGDEAESEEESAEEVAVEVEATEEVKRTGDYLDAVESAIGWAKEAVVLAGLVSKQGKKETDSEYQTRIEGEAKKLIKRVVANGEFYLVRAGNTRKGTGTFYTRPQLAVPTTHRTLEPLCYNKAADGTLTPKTPEEILALKICDPACGSASFLVAALHYLTDALYKSLCYHKKLDDPGQSKKITLPFGRPRTNTEADQLVPFPPNDNDRGHIFEERVKALLRRHVVERCIYGVDISPLAVEFARVSLWVETLDPELPFSFLDHKIKVGNSLVGCWLDRVEDYPLKAWDREGGDGKDGPHTKRIEALLKGEKIGNRRTGDGRIKQEMRQVIESKFSNQPALFPDLKLTTESIVTEARTDYEKLHDLPLSDPDERERYYREHVENSSAIRTLKAAMDEWCAVWFWPTDEESLKHVPTPLSFHKSSAPASAVVSQVTSELHFFHWELEFPDVFTAIRSGFDCVLGNPPWENSQPNVHEFFTEYDPLFRTLGRLVALRRMKSLFDSHHAIEDSWIAYCGGFKAFSNWVTFASDPTGTDSGNSLGRGAAQLVNAWRTHIHSRRSVEGSHRPFRHQSGRMFTYKLFLECSHSLLTCAGRLGMIVPSGIYSDSWSLPLRTLFLKQSTLEWLFGFINWERIFSIYYRFKFCIVIVVRTPPKSDHAIRASFGRYSLRDWENADGLSISLPVTSVMEFSPRTLTVLEISGDMDLKVCRTLFSHSTRLGDATTQPRVEYAIEFMMNSDAKLFPPLDTWTTQGFKPDKFGRWHDANNTVALPLYEGRMIGQFDPSQKGWVTGKGRTAVWRLVPHDNKYIAPQYLMEESVFRSSARAWNGLKVVFMDIASSTNARTAFAVVLKGVPCGHSAPTLRVGNGLPEETLLLSAVINSLSFDFIARQRIGGLHLTWFILEECAIPVLRKPTDSSIVQRLIANAARLSFIQPQFAPEWLWLKDRGQFESLEWKLWWAVTEADRLRLRLECDAMCAFLYGLDSDEIRWMLRNDPTDPKGFWRIDKHLPEPERYVTLAVAACRTFEIHEWTATSAASLSNDEFFEILGIPELTNAEAAKAKGESGPLILKRNGCHVWKPENFPSDDPRHGWTWDDCWKDAVALLGSDAAVQKYIAGEPEQPVEEVPEHKGSKDLFGNPIPVKSKQKKMF